MLETMQKKKTKTTFLREEDMFSTGNENYILIREENIIRRS